jgi:hypothetical protein
MRTSKVSRVRKNRSSKSGTLTASRWSKYALGSAATAIAGVGASVTPVEAEIHYSGEIRQIVYASFPRSTTNAFFPLISGASLEFVHGLSTYRKGAAFVGVHGATVQSIRGESAQAAKLHPGDYISRGQFTSGGLIFLAFHSATSNPWGRRAQGFVGFKFDVGKGVQYGWARVRMNGAPVNAMKIIDYAWADPGESITAGQIDANNRHADLAPASGSLGLLALGATGLRAWRETRGGLAVR